MAHITAQSRPRILLITLEFREWKNASHYPYPANFGFEEAFEANGVDYTTIPAPSVHEIDPSSQVSWLKFAREICAGKRYDQVWMEIAHSSFSEEVLQWFAEIAPVRMGIVLESIEMAPEEKVNNPVGVEKRLANMEKHLRYVTHIVGCDEADVARFNAEGRIPALWWPAGYVPQRFVHTAYAPPKVDKALFYGTLYGERRLWLEHPLLQDLVYRPEQSPEDATDYPTIFNEMSRSVEHYLAGGQAYNPEIFHAYTDSLRRIRKECFSLWLEGLRQGAAVINLPQFAKAYASRVIEGMAAGRPVITWKIPNRPLTESLFEDGREILLYSREEPEQLAEHIMRIRREPDFGRKIAENATKKMLAEHTNEYFVRRALHWIENGESMTMTSSPKPNSGIIPGELTLAAAGRYTRNEADFLRSFFAQGDTVFDIGANIGAKAELLLQGGANVVCFEPQPDCVEILKRKFYADPRVTIVPKGVADKAGVLELSVCTEANTISTFSDDWKKGRFSDYKWDSTIAVDVITLDQAIASYGRPAYAKIDVEGFELEVLRGLSSPIPYLSFEFTSEYLGRARQCVRHLESIGYTAFNVSLGESSFLALSRWLSADELFSLLQNSPDTLLWGDIFAKFEGAMNSAGENYDEELLRELLGSPAKDFVLGGPSGAEQNSFTQAPQNTFAQAPQRSQTAAQPSANVIEEFERDPLGFLQRSGLWQPGQALRLHLGCGETHLDGYVNIDYPPSEHNVMQVAADVFADITRIQFPAGSVDEIRLHHVFEHFNRVTGLGMLIKWQQQLRNGGRLHIETPDLMGCAQTLVSSHDWQVKMGMVRHLTGDQAASWAYHVEQWFPERFEHTLMKLGFADVRTETVQWPHKPFLSNVHAFAAKARTHTQDELLNLADELLWENTVADAELPTWEVWRGQLRDFIFSGVRTEPSNNGTPVNTMPDTAQIASAAGILSQGASQMPLNEIYDFNQNNRDRWVAARAASVPAGAKVLDVGAGTCPYKSLFAHCDYRTHDFKQYEGVKLGNTHEYGHIDYVSDVKSIPVPDNSFDVILCTEVLEHVPEPIEALREMARIVRPGGRIFITAPLGSGLHQLPYHFYGGYTPFWYRHFAEQFGLDVKEITPNGGFFRLLAQECARVSWTLGEHAHLHANPQFIQQLFGEWLPRYLSGLEEKHLNDQFTIGYHVELTKPGGNTYGGNIPSQSFSAPAPQPFSTPVPPSFPSAPSYSAPAQQGFSAPPPARQNPVPQFTAPQADPEPQSLSDLLNLAAACIERMDFDAANRYLTAALAIEPDNQQVRNFITMLQQFRT